MPELEVQRTDAQAHEAMFQIAGLGEMLSAKTMGLPSSIKSLSLKSHGEVSRVVCRPGTSGDDWDIVGLDQEGRVVSQMLGYASATLRPLTSSEVFITELETIAIERQEVKVVVEAAAKHGPLKEHPALAQSEQEVFDTLKTEKRQHEWFAGRLVTKGMLQEHFAKRGNQLSLTQITLVPDALGRPRVAVAGTIRNDVAVSISHSAGWVVVVVDGALESVGIDIEEDQRATPIMVAAVLYGK